MLYIRARHLCQWPRGLERRLGYVLALRVWAGDPEAQRERRVWCNVVATAIHVMQACMLTASPSAAEHAAHDGPRDRVTAGVEQAALVRSMRLVLEHTQKTQMQTNSPPATWGRADADVATEERSGELRHL